MNRNITVVFIHLLSCFAFLALPYVFAEDGFAKLAEVPHNAHEWRNLLIPVGASYESNLNRRFGS